MKYIKMLGLVAVVATALMAFIGAGSASATVFCKEKPTGEGTTCPAGQAYPGGTTTHEVNEGVVKLTTTFDVIECEESIIEVEIEKEGGVTETLKGPVKKLTFGKCNCTVTVLTDGTQEVHWIPGTINGTITSTGSEVTASCSTVFGNVHCIYKTNQTDIGDYTGGAGAKVDIESTDIPRLTTNSLCAEEARWDGKYKVESPNPLFIASHT
jgi:hypothetical protein